MGTLGAVESPGQARGRAQVVGRGAELATAAAAFETARRGQGRVLAVTGPAGSGKTWLGEAIAERAADEGFRVGWGSCWPGGGVPPTWPWREAFGALGGAGQLFDVGDGDDRGFAWCAAVVDRLRALGTERPMLVVIDDVHLADEPTLRLTHFVARHVHSLALVLVVTHEPSAEVSANLDAVDAIAAAATVVPLRGLAPNEVAGLLAAHGVDDLDDSDLAFVASAASGLPKVLHELARATADGAGLVGALVDRCIAELPAAPGRFAAIAACAAAAADGRPPRFTEMAAVARALGLDPQAALAELERRGLLRLEAPDTLVLGHARLDAALIETIPPHEALDIHGALAAQLAAQHSTRDRRLALARHALAAAARSADEAQLAVRAAQDAAAETDDPDRAGELLGGAVAVHETTGIGPAPSALLVAWGRALLRGGHLASAREQFRRAVPVAQVEADDVSLAWAALGLGGVWLAEERSPLERQRYLDLLRQARAALPHENTALRLRLDVRLAAELAYETGDIGPVEEHVATVRALGDPALLADALSLQHHALLGPAHRTARRRAVDEMIGAAARAHDEAASVMALFWLTADQFLAGDPQVRRTLATLRAQSKGRLARHAGYIASVMEVTLLQRDGRLAEAERAAEAAFGEGIAIGDVDALAFFGGQVMALRWIQGRSREALELAAATDASPTITPLNHVFTASLACLAASCGDHGRARSELARLRGGLRTMPQTSAYLVTLFCVVEAAHVLGDAAVAADAAELLAPYAELPVVSSPGVGCLGSVRRSLGLAAVTTGDLDAGIELLAAAVTADERLGNRPVRAVTLADLARSLVARGRADDLRTAAELLDLAIGEARAMDLPVRVEEWSALRADVAGQMAPADAEADAPGPAPFAASDAEVGRVERNGRSWVLCFAGHEVVVPDRLGMRYLVRLLLDPAVEITAAQLMAGESGAATQAPSDERARTSVQKAVRRTLEQIEQADPAAGAVLRRSIRTGRICSYDPAPGAPRHWHSPAPPPTNPTP